MGMEDFMIESSDDVVTHCWLIGAKLITETERLLMHWEVDQRDGYGQSSQ